MKRLVLKPKTCMFWLTFLCLLVHCLIEVWYKPGFCAVASLLSGNWWVKSCSSIISVCRCINEVLCCHLYCKKISPPTLRRQLEGITGFLLRSSHLGITRSFSSIPWINCNSIMSSVRGFLYMYIQGTTWDCADTLCWSSLTFFLVLSSSYNVSNGLHTAINPSQFIEISLSNVYMDFY